MFRMRAEQNLIANNFHASSQYQKGYNDDFDGRRLPLHERTHGE